ncbi:Hsp70 family protein, partial [Dietzia sp. UBA5065]
ANGIVHVTAKDKGTGKENTIIIQDGSGLSKEEIDQMIKDAEAHAEEDHKRREEADARNQAESTIYQTEKFVSENKDAGKVSADRFESIETAIAEAKTALEGTDVDAIKAAVEKINTEAQAVGQAIYEASAAEGAQAGAEGGSAGSADDDVVDAEVVDEDESKGDSK